VIRPRLPAPLLRAACDPYRRAGRYAYHFARGKLGGDPAFRAILERGLLQGHRRVLDLGCGQGLLCAWLQAAQHCIRQGAWPSHWPAMDAGHEWRGIELMPRAVARAHRALGADCGVVQGDIRVSDFGSVDAVVILDVLHYMEPAAQRAVLERVYATLPAGGRLLLRVGDAGSGLRFRYSQWVDKTVMLAAGHGRLQLHCRSLTQWRELLQLCHFTSEALPMSEGTPFANVLLVATPEARTAP
jgi:SAM-dependent methyltransferase